MTRSSNVSWFILLVTKHYSFLQEIDPAVMDADEIPNEELGQNPCECVCVCVCVCVCGGGGGGGRHETKNVYPQ